MIDNKANIQIKILIGIHSVKVNSSTNGMKKLFKVSDIRRLTIQERVTQYAKKWGKETKREVQHAITF